MYASAAQLAVALLAATTFAGAAGAQTQVVDTSDPVVIVSTTPVVIDTVSVATAGTRDVALAAHLSVLGSGFDGGGYEFRLERTTPSVAVIGTTNWVPAVALNASAAGDTLSFTGIDEGVAAPATYRLVGQKLDADAPTLVVTPRGIHALDRIASTVVEGVRAAGSLGVSSTTLAPILSLDVDVPLASDVLLWGHVTLATPGGSDGYGIAICDAAGSAVGASVWFPGAGTAETNVVAIAAWAENVAGDTTFSLCANRVGSMPVATATYRSLQSVRATSGIFGNFGDPGDAPTLTGTSYTPIWIMDAATPHPDGMAILLQTTLVTLGYDNQLYEFGIHRDSCAGTRLGGATWRQGESPTTDSATDPFFMTAFDPLPSEPQSYALCARKANAAAPDLSFYGITMAAAPLPAPEPAGAAMVLASVAVLASLAHSRRRSHGPRSGRSLRSAPPARKDRRTWTRLASSTPSPACAPRSRSTRSRASRSTACSMHSSR